MIVEHPIRDARKVKKLRERELRLLGFAALKYPNWLTK